MRKVAVEVDKLMSGVLAVLRAFAGELPFESTIRGRREDDQKVPCGSFRGAGRIVCKWVQDLHRIFQDIDSPRYGLPLKHFFPASVQHRALPWHGFLQCSDLLSTIWGRLCCGLATISWNVQFS